jgi:hypothetical protein
MPALTALTVRLDDGAGDGTDNQSNRTMSSADTAESDHARRRPDSLLRRACASVSPEGVLATLGLAAVFSVSRTTAERSDRQRETQQRCAAVAQKAARP